MKTHNKAKIPLKAKLLSIRNECITENLDQNQTWVFVDKRNNNEFLLLNKLMTNNKTSNKLKIFILDQDSEINNYKKEFFYFDEDGNYANTVRVEYTPFFVKLNKNKLETKYVKLSSDTDINIANEIVAKFIH